MSERNLDELLVPYVRDELEPLEAQWVAARVAREPALQTRVDSMRGAFESARAYEPKLDEAHRARLLARLQSVAPTHRRRWGFVVPARGVALVVGAFAVTLALGFFLGRGDAERAEPVALAASSLDFGEFDEVVELEIDAQQRSELNRHLRTVVSRDWVGSVDAGERETQVRVEAGTIAFGFRGGEGRRLEVATAHARVVVVGTRFSVGVAPDGRSTRVEVSQGRVQVWRSDGAQGRKRIDVEAGEVALVDADRAFVKRGRVAAVLDDPYLVEVTGQKQARKRVKALDFSDLSNPLAEASAETPADAAPAGVPSLERHLALLERADAASRRGALEEALALYGQLISESDAPMIGNMAKLGRARALGRKGQVRLALEELDALAIVPGEVGRQAQLSHCGVQRRFQPCEALRCFDALAADPDRQLAEEAKRLAKRTRAAGLRCEGAR
ncbi:MAG: FecR family protein [Myxococcota bacterium]